MDRAIRLLLQIGLVLASIAAFAASVRMLRGFLLGWEWYWGGVVAAYLGPVAFALALYLYDWRLPAPKDVPNA